MRLIASAYSKRVPAFPEMPTAAEQGFPDVDLSAWLGVVAAARTPKERIDRLGATIGAIVASPDIAEKFANLGAVPRVAGPQAFAAFLASEDTRWGAVVKAAGVKIE
jgi:tripartite-type tricarboxylate transporter receptor subunit TctC